MNFDLPEVSEHYVHRIGRTGRAGNEGLAISLVAHDERPLLKQIERLLAPLGISPVLVTGSLSARARKAVATALASTEPVLVVGTHALVQESTQFGRLGLAVVDEQHRFGVEQRLALSRKGERPDVLLMSATPIPRSLALTVYGDLDVSVLDELPPGRQPVTTVRRPEKAREKVMAFVDAQVAKGRQAYIVYPLIEESDKIALKAATKDQVEFRELTVPQEYYPPGGSPRESWRSLFYANLVSSFITEILDKSPANEGNFDDGAHVQELINAVEKSFRERRWVSIPLGA